MKIHEKADICTSGTALHKPQICQCLHVRLYSLQNYEK
jgi:hypothetical protein